MLSFKWCLNRWWNFNLIAFLGIRTIAPRGKLCPGQDWGLGQGQGKFQGWGVNQTIAPEENSPPVRIGVWVKVRVSFRVGGQPENCPRGKQPPGQRQGLGQGQFWGWGTISLGGNCPRTVFLLYLFRLNYEQQYGLVIPMDHAALFLCFYIFFVFLYFSVFEQIKWLQSYHF